MKKYLDLGRRLLEEGEWIYNERTGKSCLTMANVDLTFDVGAGEFPILTTKKTFWRSAVAEILGYLKGFNSAADFRNLGTRTWDANANENKDWLDNVYRKGKDDMGLAYGSIARNWPVRPMPIGLTPEYRQKLIDSGKTEEEADALTLEKVRGLPLDLVKKVYTNLKAGIDDRFEAITFYNPAEVERACLRPCMYEHIFTLINGTLHLRSVVRSNDFCLGNPFNMIQGYFLLAVMAQITGHKAGKWTMSIVNLHVYEDHIDGLKEQLSREPFEPTAKFHISPDIKTLEDLEAATLIDFNVTGYDNYHPKIDFPFAV